MTYVATAARHHWFHAPSVDGEPTAVVILKTLVCVVATGLLLLLMSLFMARTVMNGSTRVHTHTHTHTHTHIHTRISQSSYIHTGHTEHT
jgi:hypothetical protein